MDAVLSVLRRDGSVVVPADDLDNVEEFRRSVRRACRAAGLRIRTGVTDSGAIWIDHVDHVVTDAERRAVARTLDNMFSGTSGPPFHELVREEQRKQLTAVKDAPEPASPPERARPDDIELLIIEYGCRQHAFKVDEDRFLRQWSARVSHTDDDGVVLEDVGLVIAYTVDYDQMANPYEALDAESGGLSHIADALFEHSGEMRPEVDELIEAFGSGLLVVDTLQLVPRWRGHGLGPLVMGMVIECLGEGKRFVALHAAPAEYLDGEGNEVGELSEADWNAAVQKLGTLWAQLGFQTASGDVWVLDLSSRMFADRMAVVRRQCGLT